MRKIFIPILFISVCIGGCSQKMTEETLMEGTWIATSGYEDGEETGDPDCFRLEDGIQFTNENNVYIATSDKDIEYILSEEDSKITFFHTLQYSYRVKKISENKMALEGLDFSEGRNCVMERRVE